MRGGSLRNPGSGENSMFPVLEVVREGSNNEIEIEYPVMISRQEGTEF